MKKKLTDFQISMRGQLMVNLPVLLIILGSFVLLDTLLKDSRGILFISVIPGWVYWKFMTPVWVKWAVKNGVDTERLYSIGKNGSLIWSRQYIEDVVERNKKPWM